MSFKKNSRVRHKKDASKGIGTVLDVASELATIKWDDDTTTIAKLSDLKAR